MEGLHAPLSPAYARNRLGIQKKIPDRVQAVSACNDRGCFRSIESVFFSKEVRPKGSRQNLDVEKFFESLLDSLIHRRNGHDLILSPTKFVVEINRASFQQRERKKLLSQMKKFRSLSSKEIETVISMLNTRGVPLQRLFGIEFLGTCAHYSEDFARFRHCIGLSDAIHLSSKNLGVKVSYPAPCLRQVERKRRIFHPFARTVSTGKHLLMKEVFIRGETRNSRFRLTLHYLRVFPKGLKEKELVKLIKTSLVDAFCVQAEQERPQGDVIPLFPKMTQRKLDRRFQFDRRNRIRFYKNLLESKSLCAPVGADMIQEAYVKHKASLCRPQEEVLVVPEDFLRKLYQRGVEVGKFVSKVYNPYETRLPNGRATVETPVHKGGARKALEGHREVTRGPRYLNMLEDATRPEPFVIGLFGPPGSGKTTTVQSLVTSLTSAFFPHLKGEASYSRSCSSKFWDGYKGQPIVILDDFGQSLSDRSDLVEFEQLVSVNRFQLEMANLDEKGRVFSSPIIIVTSNMAYGSRLKDSSVSPVVIEDMAVWRRFHFPILVSKSEKGQTTYSTYNSHLLMESSQKTWIANHRSGNSSYFVGWNEGRSILPTEFRNSFIEKELGFHEVVSTSCQKFRQHTDFHEDELSPSWRQTITCQSLDVRQSKLPPFYDVDSVPVKFARTQQDVTVSQLFPRYPPFHAPVVEAIALPEPLKVRMITKAEADTKCLQPLQKALFQFLRSEPQFALTHGVTWNKDDETFEEKLEWIHRIEDEIKKILKRSDENDLWLSGDYTAATDNFPMSVTNALVEGILSQINHEPTRAWTRYEVSPHRIRYPNSGIGKQTSGQLMGSLLSFPLLCLLNDFIVSESGFEQGKYLINGDDVVASGPSHVIETWRRNAPTVGLSLSLGKNFIDKQFCTVNSQLFWEGTVLHTGKVSCQTRYGKTLSRCYSESQFYYGNSEELRREFIRRNLVELRKTPRSMDVPCSHGGLALDFSRRAGVDLNLAKKVYLKDYLSKFSKSLPVPGYDHIRALLVPTGFLSDEELQLGGGEDQSLSSFELLRSIDTEVVESPQRELSHSDLQKFFNRLDEGKGSHWERLKQIPLSHWPELGQMRGRMVYIQKGKVGFLKERTVHLALDLLLAEARGRESADPDVSMERIIHETFDDEWLRLFETDNLPLDGQIPEISERNLDDSLEHLLPVIEENWVLPDSFPHSALLKTLMETE
jgi:GTPase SAR1 family protein